MLAEFLLGIVHNRRLMREEQADIAVRWIIDRDLHDRLLDHTSLTRIRQRLGRGSVQDDFPAHGVGLLGGGNSERQGQGRQRAQKGGRPACRSSPFFTTIGRLPCFRQSPHSTVHPQPDSEPDRPRRDRILQMLTEHSGFEISALA